MAAPLVPETFWRTALREASSLLFPTWCAGCDEPGHDLCPSCAADLAAAEPAHRDLDGLDVWAATRFEGVAARVVRALKEDGRTALARPLGALLGGPIDRALNGTLDRVPDRAAGLASDRAAGRPSARAGVVLVPLPASRASLRGRGYAVVELLVRRTGHDWAPLLRVARAADDQRGLGRDERARNTAGTLWATDAAAGASVVIVDDVVTTGATLLEARRALVAAGAHVCAAVTVADTPRRFPPAIPE